MAGGILYLLRLTQSIESSEYKIHLEWMWFTPYKKPLVITWHSTVTNVNQHPKTSHYFLQSASYSQSSASPSSTLLKFMGEFQLGAFTLGPPLQNYAVELWQL